MKPFFTIITVSYNEEATIEGTIKSVLNQTFKDFEYIIIDGGSKDKTVDIIKKYSNQISIWVSEKDQGIFDAMNKGIELSSGTWLNFMNSGDSFYDTSVLLNVSKQIISASAVVYGNTNNVWDNNSIEKPRKINSLKYGLIMACHQSMFFNKPLLIDELNFKSSHKYYCDYELVNRLYLKSYPIQYIDVTVASYLGNGFSSSISSKARKVKFKYVFKSYGISGVLRVILIKLKLINKPNRIK